MSSNSIALTIDEAAEYTGIRRNTLRQLVEWQKVPTIYVGKRLCKKKGKKWYLRYYVEYASGNRIQKECVGTKSKAETEKLLRKAMEDYEEKQFVAKTNSITLADLLDMWAEEELKTGSLSSAQSITICKPSREPSSTPLPTES